MAGVSKTQQCGEDLHVDPVELLAVPQRISELRTWLPAQKCLFAIEDFTCFAYKWLELRAISVPIIF